MNNERNKELRKLSERLVIWGPEHVTDAMLGLGELLDEVERLTALAETLSEQRNDARKEYSLARHQRSFVWGELDVMTTKRDLLQAQVQSLRGAMEEFSLTGAKDYKDRETVLDQTAPTEEKKHHE